MNALFFLGMFPWLSWVERVFSKKAAAVSPKRKTETVGSSIPVGDGTKMKQKCFTFLKESESKKKIR